MRVYVVQKGDTMWKIAQRYGLTLDTLIRANPQIQNPNVLQVGDRLNLPVDGVAAAPVMPTPPAIPYANPPVLGLPVWPYVVKSGDTLWKIAHQVGVPFDALLRANPQIPDPDKIMPGQTINIPGHAPSHQPPHPGPAYGPPASYKEAMTAPHYPPSYKEKLTSPKEIYTAPITPPPVPPVPPIHIDADFNFAQIKEVHKEVKVEPKMPKLKPAPPAIAKIYVKQETVAQPKCEQIICWDPCNPPPYGPIFEGPIVPAGSVIQPFAPIHQPILPPMEKVVKMRESSSLWGRDSSWFNESSS